MNYDERKYRERIDGIERRMIALVYSRGWQSTALGRITFSVELRRNNLELERINWRAAMRALS